MAFSSGTRRAVLVAAAAALAPARAQASPALYRRLPPPLDFGWTPRTPENTRTGQAELAGGALEIRIDHAPLTGVNSAMLDWWFQNFDGEARYRGQTVPAYRLWHPRDHIAVAFTRNSEGRLAPGQRVHIEEVFARDERFTANVRARIHRWDRGGIGFHVEVLGHRLMQLDHAFTDSAEGLLYRTRAQIGASSGPLRAPLNAIARSRFGAEKSAAWVRHNIEEVGFFVDFLPELYSQNAIAR